ncbi:MAG: FMN-binding glutamate synthase family protein, partial [Candidatus Aenigmatarchaeota archaeon]
MEEWVNEIKQRALTGKPLVSGGRTNKLEKISFDDLVFVPAQLTKRPIDYFREEIVSETVIGKNSNHPLKLKIPIMIGAMSFGALSKEAKIALAKASSIVGTATNTGEGGMLPEERQNAKTLIVQYSTGRFGITEEVLKKADAIEIKIGQGAKPGQGGLLPADKVTEEIAKIRNVPMGKDVHSPPAHPDVFSV